METCTHDMHALFSQLGLPATDEAIDQFISDHKSLKRHVLLYDAPFWNGSQSMFLKEALDEDADWIEAVDSLDSMLR